MTTKEYQTVRKITEHFSWDEAACHDGTRVPDDLVPNAIKLAQQLEVIRFELGETPLHIISWYRTPAYNSNIPGSAKNSQHMKAKAADIVHRFISPTQVYNRIEKLIEQKKIVQGGLGLYKSFVHYDIRGYKARWRG